MEQKRTGLSYVFTLAKEERGKLSLGMLLAVFSSALSFVPYLVVYQILLLIIKQEVTLPAMLGWAGIGIAAAVLQAILTSFAGICSYGGFQHHAQNQGQSIGAYVQIQPWILSGTRARTDQNNLV